MMMLIQRMYVFPGVRRRAAFIAAPSEKAARVRHSEARLATIEELSAAVAELSLVPKFDRHGQQDDFAMAKDFVPYQTETV
jgi:hypothetical protein